MEFKELRGRMLVLDTPENYKTVTTFIHPYRKRDANTPAETIDGYKGKFFTEKDKDAVLRAIYAEFSEDNETMLQFVNRFGLKWETRDFEVTQVIVNPPQGLVIQM